jgi:hypothetical protein
VPLAIVVAVALWLVKRQESSAAKAVIAFEAGDLAMRVAGLEVQLRRVGEEPVLGTFMTAPETAQPDGSAGRWPLTVPSGDYELTIAVELAGERRTAKKRVHLEDEAVVHVDLGPLLRANLTPVAAPPAPSAAPANEPAAAPQP